MRPNISNLNERVFQPLSPPEFFFFFLPSSPFTLLQDAQYGDGGEDDGLLKHLGSGTPVGGE